MGHGLQDRIVEFNGSRDEEGTMGWLRRHLVFVLVVRLLGNNIRVNRGRGSLDRLIFQIVGLDRQSFGRERRVQFRQRQPLVEMSGNEGQAGITIAIAIAPPGV